MALTRITKGVIKPNENYDTHNIVSTGIVTAIGLDINGNGDVSGNLNVGGVLTYEDVTSIDSVGIITAQKDIHVGAGVSAVGVGTFGSLDIGGDIDVDGHTNLDNLSIAGVTTMNSTLNIVSAQPLIHLNNTSYENDYQVQNLAGTFTVRDIDRGNNVFQIGKTGLSTFSGQLNVQGNVTFDSDLDVDGHTNLDNVSVAGVTSCANSIHLNQAVPEIKFNSTTHENDFRLINYQGNFIIQDEDALANRLVIQSNGDSTFQRNVIVSGNIDANSDLDVDGHTNLDNVSITGFTTITDGRVRIISPTIANSLDSIIIQGGSSGMSGANDSYAKHGITFLANAYTSSNVTRTGAQIYMEKEGSWHQNHSSPSGYAYGALVFQTSQSPSGGTATDRLYWLRERLRISAHGNVGIGISRPTSTLHVSGTSLITGISTFSSDLDVDGHTNLDNVSIAGVTTTSGNLTANHSNGQVMLKPSDGSIEITKIAGGAYIDFKNSTSEDYDARINEEGGHLRVNTHFRLYDNKALELGNRTSSTYGDLRLYHDTTNSFIENHTGQLSLNNSGGNITIRASDTNADFILRVGGSTASENAIVAVHHGEVVLSCNGATKLTTTSTGITVTGNINATGGQLTLENGNEEQIHRFWDSNTDSDINTLLQNYASSSTFGTVVEGAHNGHHVIALRDNDNADSFAIISGSSNYQSDTTYDKIIARFKSDGKIIFGGNTTNENVTLEILPGGTAGNYSQLVLGRTSSAPAVQTTAVVKGGNALSGVPGIIFGSSNTNLPCVSVETPNSTNGHIVFKPKGTEKVRIDDGGTVVIGDSSSATPTGVLHLYQASNDPYLVIQRGVGDSGVDLGGYYIRNNTNTQVMMKAYQSNINTANLHFYTNYGGSFADRFLMEAIGTLKLQSGNTDEKLSLQGSSNPLIRFKESTTNRAYIGWNNTGDCLDLVNQQDSSGLRIKDTLQFTQDGSTYYNVAHTGNYISHAENYTAYFVGTNTSDTSIIDEQKVRFYKVSIDTVSLYGGVNYVDIVRAGVHDNNGLHGMWVGSMDVRIKVRTSNCGNGSHYSRFVHNYHANTGSVTQGQGGGNIARIDSYLACLESSRLYVWLRGQLTYYIRVNGRPANIYAIDMNDYRTTMHSSVMPASWDGEGRDALSIMWGYQGQTGAGRKLYGTSGGVEAQGNVSATGSKPFKIPHPLVGLSTTKNLVHAAIEGPQCDNIYRGKTTLVAGISTVNIDTNAGMTDGTFATLNRDVQCFTTNETGWTPIKGSVSGNQLTILAQDSSCTDTISWMVVGERQDDNIINNTMTDSQGHLIVEPDFEEITEPDDPGTFAAGSSQIDEKGEDRTFTQPLSS